MISFDAWDLFTNFLIDLYQWADSTIIIGFSNYSISLFDLWISFTSIVIFLELILSPIFGIGHVDIHKYHREDDGY